jgi:hypothetical protein
MKASIEISIHIEGEVLFGGEWVGVCHLKGEFCVRVMCDH